jgi:YfiR/HmsC-like
MPRDVGRRGRKWTSLGIIVVVLFAAMRASRAADPVPEPALKAEVVERITRYVDWPSASFASENTPFTICIMGDNPFGDYLVKMAKQRTIQGRRVVVLTISDVGRLGTCNLLFVGRSEDRRLDKILALTADHPVLTVGDTNGYGARGVLVNFYRDGDRIGFEINVHAVDRSGLRISSRVLRLAKILGKRS